MVRNELAGPFLAGRARQCQIPRIDLCAPTGQAMSAQGKAAQPPQGHQNTIPREPQRGALVPNVALVDFDAMFLAERPKFILIGHPAMMFLLRRDVGPDLLDVRLADGK